MDGLFGKKYKKLLEDEDCSQLLEVPREESTALFSETDSSDVYSQAPASRDARCLPPNPAPSELDFSEKPMIVGSESIPCMATKTKHVRGMLIDPFYAGIMKLQEEILSPGGVEVRAYASNLLSDAAFVELDGSLWVAGWNQKCAPLHGLFHVGDQVVSANDFPVSTPLELTKALKSKRLAYRFRWCSEDALDSSLILSVDSTQPLHRLRIRRLPHARALIACRQYAGQSLGVAFENGTNVVKSISQDGPLACTGLPLLAPAFRFGGKSPQKHGLRLLKSRFQHTEEPCSVPWTLTEINNRPVNLFYSKNEAASLIDGPSMEISLVFQPADFINALKKKLQQTSSFKKFST
ncbi:hypothetical protein SprV_0100419500 [Sparganum proliferum]